LNMSAAGKWRVMDSNEICTSAQVAKYPGTSQRLCREPHTQHPVRWLQRSGSAKAQFIPEMSAKSDKGLIVAFP